MTRSEAIAAIKARCHCCEFFPQCVNDKPECYQAAEMAITALTEPERKKGKCAWCSSPYRIEYYWIDRDGNTASFQDKERHLVATGIANFCPNCGSEMRGEEDDND